MVETLRVAFPCFNTPVLIEVEPALKVTAPAAVEGETVAVKVTVWPSIDGFGDEVSSVVVGVLFTVWVTAAEVLGLYLELPL
jgi:hypothetical protein